MNHKAWCLGVFKPKLVVASNLVDVHQGMLGAIQHIAKNFCKTNLPSCIQCPAMPAIFSGPEVKCTEENQLALIKGFVKDVSVCLFLVEALVALHKDHDVLPTSVIDVDSKPNFFHALVLDSEKTSLLEWLNEVKNNQLFYCGKKTGIHQILLTEALKALGCHGSGFLWHLPEHVLEALQKIFPPAPAKYRERTKVFYKIVVSLIKPSQLHMTARDIAAMVDYGLKKKQAVRQFSTPDHILIAGALRRWNFNALGDDLKNDPDVYLAAIRCDHPKEALGQLMSGAKLVNDPYLNWSDVSPNFKSLVFAMMHANRFHSGQLNADSSQCYGYPVADLSELKWSISEEHLQQLNQSCVVTFPLEIENPERRGEKWPKAQNYGVHMGNSVLGLADLFHKKQIKNSRAMWYLCRHHRIGADAQNILENHPLFLTSRFLLPGENSLLSSFWADAVPEGLSMAEQVLSKGMLAIFRDAASLLQLQTPLSGQYASYKERFLAVRNQNGAEVDGRPLKLTTVLLAGEKDEFGQLSNEDWIKHCTPDELPFVLKVLSNMV